MSIKEFIESDNPFNDEFLINLLEMNDEPDFCDFKEKFDNSDREYLEITKDITAFANSNGGYIIFGVEDKTFQKIGLDESTINILSDINKIQQKMNSYIEPAIQSLRFKKIENEGFKFGVFFIPESKGKTHIICKDGNYFDGKKTNCVLRQGFIYIRRNATNVICNARDFDMIVEKRIQYYKTSLFDKIAKVIEAPATSNIIITDGRNETGQPFYLSDSPDAIPVKGLSFTIEPQSNEELISCFIALNKSDKNLYLPNEKLWKIYSERESLLVNVEQKKFLLKFSLINEMPFFFWIRDLTDDDIKDILNETFNEHSEIKIRTLILKASSIYGKRYYNNFLKRFGKAISRINPAMKNYNPKIVENFDYLNIHTQIIENGKKIKQSEIHNKLNQIIDSFLNSEDIVMNKHYIIGFDCYLYYLHKGNYEKE